jgi:SHS2 domain-containing protein
MTYRFLEHTGEVELELEATSEETLFAEALAALRELTGGSEAGMPERRELEIVAPDSSLLLADWLGELTVLAELEQFVAERVVAIAIDGLRLSATVEGRRGEPPHLVKAVTLSGLDVRQEGESWHGHVVLDV